MSCQFPCCKTGNGVFWSKNSSYSYGVCTPTQLRLWTNSSVSATCVSANNVLVKLNDTALKRVSEAFDGSPLKVTFSTTVECCGCCGCCCDCCSDCSLRREQFSAFDEIWFVNKSQKSCFEGVLACCINSICVCAPILVNEYCVKSISIHPSWVSPVSVGEPMDHIASQPSTQ